MAVSQTERATFIRQTTESYNDTMRYADAAHRTEETRRGNYFYAMAIKDGADMVIERFSALPAEAEREEFFIPVRKTIETVEKLLESAASEELESLGGRDAIQSMLYGYSAVTRNFI